MRWIVALVAVAAAAGLRFALDPWLGAAHPFPLFLGAVIVAAWFGGIAPAFLAAIAGYMAADYFFIEPRGFFAPRTAVENAGLAVYLLSSLLIIGLGGAMHAARRRAEASEERLSLDVTEQARVAEDLRRQREELRLVTDTMPAGVVRVSGDLRYVWVNRVFASWVGRRAEEIIGQAVVDVLGQRDWHDLRPHVERTLRGERVEYERRARFATGERWIYAVMEPTRDERGAPNGLVAVVSDIESRKQAEAALESAREQIQLVADGMPAGVALCSRDLRFVWVNRRYAEWVGATPRALAGRPIGEVIGADNLDAIRPYVERVLAGEAVEYERLTRHAGIGERWVRNLFAPTRDGSGWIAVGADIHDRKLMEETLRQAERRKDEFLATLAHELRNPLAPIRNAVAILGKKDALDPELTWSREVIERQVDQMSRLIEDLLDIARIAGGKLLIRKERLPLERAIDMALETSRPHINAAGHSLAVLLPSERVTVEADAARLAQVFSNLLNNAARYTERHGEIALTAEVHAEEVVVTVQDNGIGFPPEVAGRLFEPFSQLTRSNERAHGGLGIGLSLVQGIVALHGGSVQARSRGRGQGAEFAVRLPLPKYTDPVPPAKPAAQPRPPPPLAGVKVLVADDNRDAADSLQRILSLYGYEVEVAYDGTAAIRLDGDFRPEVAVLDIGMPGANGFEVARSIRENRGAGVTLIALTGWGQEGDRRRAMEAGFDYHLTKPVDPGALNDLLVEVAK
ncbi:MAG TPA: PAS domain-containing protein [Burkholderiales bacterium]|nr:PAS domain-containing protein [Burkholderiales bacterium]